MPALFLWLGCSGGDGAGLDAPSLRVRTNTSGIELDQNGYSVSVDGAAGRLIGINASIEIGSLNEGTHEVELLDVASNCEVRGTHPAIVTTTSGNTTDLVLSVECRPSLGSVRVITRTDGPDQDEDGYVVVVAGEARQVEINTSLTFEDVPAGPAIVEILGVSSNCVAATSTYYEVAVAGGSTTDVTFAFDCSPRQPQSGTLQVTTATSGPSPDADGYLVSIDGGDAQPIGPSATELLTGLAIGARSVALSGIAVNCQVSGDNPRSVTVSGTELAAVAFAIVCTPPSSSSGTLQLTTGSSGTDLDPTGYLVRIDGGSGQPVAINGTVSIARVPAGARSILLDDVAANCTVTDNPRAVTLSAGEQVDVIFQVICGTAFGTIATTTVTTGTAIDADGYVARVNGGAGKPIPPNGTVTRGGLTPGSHTVQLDNVASNCQVQGDNPRAVLVAGNETTPVTFEVACTSTTGSLTIAVDGLPTATAARINVSGPSGFAQAVSATTTLIDLMAGAYTVGADPVPVGAEVYHPGSVRQEVNVAAGQSPTVSVTYSRDPAGDANLSIAGMYITQGSQTPTGSIPLVEGRDGLLRVFVLANADNVGRPAVRVRLFQGGTQIQTLVIEPPPGSPPTVLQEEPLNASWNIRISGQFIRPGLRIVADVDPDERVSESNEADNVFPVDGTPAQLAVHTVPKFSVRLVPIQLGSGEQTGDVSAANIGRYLEAPFNLHPLPGIDAALHEVFTSSLTPAQAGGVNEALYNALSELRLMRMVEGDSRSYYGVTHRTYSSGGIAGIGYLGHPAALGWDDPTDAGWTAAHEFGHNWNRRHTPCGGPANTDPGYPHVGGVIGVYGLDLMAERLVPPTTRDLMSYCWPRWVSDYTYEGVMAFHESQGDVLASNRLRASPQLCLVVWGRIQHGHAILEPAFLVETRPVLPSSSGPYRLEGMDGRGQRIFSLAFEESPVADGRKEEGHFSFAIPVEQSAMADLSLLRLSGPSGISEQTNQRDTDALAGFSVEARKSGGRVQMSSAGSSFRMMMVRDAVTGEVLALSRGRSIEVFERPNLEVHLSNGVFSRRATMQNP